HCSACLPWPWLPSKGFELLRVSPPSAQAQAQSQASGDAKLREHDMPVEVVKSQINSEQLSKKQLKKQAHREGRGERKEQKKHQKQATALESALTTLSSALAEHLLQGSSGAGLPPGDSPSSHSEARRDASFVKLLELQPASKLDKNTCTINTCTMPQKVMPKMLRQDDTGFVRYFGCDVALSTGPPGYVLTVTGLAILGSSLLRPEKYGAKFLPQGSRTMVAEVADLVDLKGVLGLVFLDSRAPGCAGGVAMVSVGKRERVAVSFLGVLLLVPTVIFVLGFTSTRWTYVEPCDVPGSDAEALFDYMSFFSCAEVLPQALKAVLLLVWLILLISLLASTADFFFVPQLEQLALDLRLTEDVAGVTLLALGNGMPDVMTATSSVNKAGDFSLTMGEFFGAANFIVSLVLACVILCSSGPTIVEPVAFIRDSVSFALVFCYMIFVTWDRSITQGESIMFFIIYGLYVAVVMVSTHWRLRRSLQARSDVRELEVALETTELSPSPENCFNLMESDSEAAPGEEEDRLEGLDTRAVESLFGQLQCIMELPFTVLRHLPSLLQSGIAIGGCLPQCVRHVQSLSGF
ncbi:unnamed protein product, partial [Polarella glacialis]